MFGEVGEISLVQRYKNLPPNLRIYAKNSRLPPCKEDDWEIATYNDVETQWV